MAPPSAVRRLETTLRAFAPVEAGPQFHLGGSELRRFATGAESLARIRRRIFYSPARRSVVPLVTAHVPTGVEMERHMPCTQPMPPAP